MSSTGRRQQRRAHSRVPVFTSLRGYRPGWMRGDAVAGLTVWAVLVPEALAYASIAGVSPVVGTRAIVLDCGTMPYIDVTAARMLNQLATDLRRHGVRLVLAGEIGQVRDMVAAVAGQGGTPEYHRTVQEAVTSARTGPADTAAGRHDG
jgi:MFS superfamily sulfate permease-like transporter